MPEGVDTKAMLPRAVTARVAYASGTGFYADGFGSRQLRLSYCYPTPERITEGVRRLAGVLEAELDVVHTFGRGTCRDPAGATGPVAAHAVAVVSMFHVELVPRETSRG